jgi:hypothetical protein
MLLSRWLSQLFSPRPLSGEADIRVCRWDRRKIGQLSHRPRSFNNYRPLLEELEPIVVMSNVVWTGASGDWSSAASWTDSSDSSHHVPGPSDVAVINTAVTVTHSANSDTIQSLTLGAASVASNLMLSGGTLRVTGVIQNQGTGAFTLSNGTLAGATIAAGTTLLVAPGNSGTLNGVTLNSALAVPGNTTLNITNNLVLNSATLSNNGTLNFTGDTQSVTTTGSGAISGSGTVRADTSGSSITFAAGVTLSGGLNVGAGSTGVTWIFQGTVSAGAGQTLNLSRSGDAFINQGAWQSNSGGTLTVGGIWTNNGTITVLGATSTLNLGGNFTTSAIGTFNHASGAVNITGSLDNAGATLALNNTTGTWNLSGGAINGGIITTAGSAVLNAGPNDSTLNGVTLSGTLTMPGNMIVNITNGLALDGAMVSDNGALRFRGGTQSVTGTGAITGSGGIGADISDITITFASGVTLSGSLNVGFGAAGVTWVFQGTISAGLGQTLTLSSSSDAYINHGTWQVNGGTLTLGGIWTNTGAIAETGATSTLNLSGNFATADIGTFNHTSGAINIIGSLDNAGSTLTLNGMTGTWNLTSNGAINGGTITTAGSALLNIPGSSDVTLNAVTLNGALQLANNSRLNITNGLALNGGILSVNGALNFNGTQSVTTTGTATISGSGFVSASTTGSRITLATGVTLTGSFNVGGQPGVIWIFQGTVSADAGQTLALVASDNAYINQGAWQAINGGRLNAGGNWTNNGVITVTGATSILNLGGTFATASIGTLNHTSGTINIAGALDNAGNTLALNDTTGTWNMTVFGSITGGMITTTGSAVLNIIFGTLSRVTVAGTVTMPANSTLNITNGLALNGGMLSDNGTLNFSGTQTVTTTGTGVISGGGRIQADADGSAITLASGVSLSGGLTIGAGRGAHTWIFQGSVSADTSGQTLAFASGDSFTNQGIFEARNGGRLLLPPGATFTNYSGTTLTGGAWRVFGGSIMILVGSGIATNAADILLDGSSSTIYRDAAATLDALAGLTSVSAGASLTFQDSRNFTTAANFTNNGTLNILASTIFTVNGSLTNFDSASGTLIGGAYNIAGTFRFNNADITTNAANVVLDGTGAAAIVDQTGADALGDLAVNAVTGNFTIQNGRNLASGNFSNNGTLTVKAGTTFTVNGWLTNFDGASGTLTGGAYNIAGTFQFNDAAIATNAASIVLDGTGAAAIVDQTGADALANFAANAATGTFTIQNSLTFAVPGAFTNAGSFVIGTGSALAVSGTFTQTSGGTTNLSSGAVLTSSGGVSISSGSSFSGAGTINADVINAGQMSIGDSTTTGVLTINGFFLQTASGTLTIKIGGFTTAGADFDQLVVTSAHVGGTLNVTLINGYTPASGDSIAVMTFDSATGTFASLAGDGGLFTAAYDPIDVTLTAN